MTDAALISSSSPKLDANSKNTKSRRTALAMKAAAWLARNTVEGRAARLLAPVTDRVLARPFSAEAKLKVEIYQTRSRICFSQIYPFLHHAQALSQTTGVEIRCYPVEDLLTGDHTPRGADVILVQPWFTVDPNQLAHTLERTRFTNPQARIVFLDSYAHNDLRLARYIEPLIDLYVKKSLFRDRETYFRRTFGHTNLTDHYGRMFDCAEGATDWLVPRAILPKLRTGAHFFTGPGLMEGFLGAMPDFAAPRPIDVHARLTARGSGWYSAMRADCVTRAGALPGRIVTGTGISRRRFMAELGRSKLVFSPFGYGELCWRDIEGFMAGAVVIKQDMGHLETRPDLYRPWETYAPVAWDLSDLEDVVDRLLTDRDLRMEIAENAWLDVHRYLVGGEVLRDMGAILTGDAVADQGAEVPPLPQAAVVAD